jgi:hypothetical protein
MAALVQVRVVVHQFKLHRGEVRLGLRLKGLASQVDTFTWAARPRLTFLRRFTPRRTRAAPFARATLTLNSPSTRGSQHPLTFRAAECACYGPYKDGPFPLGGVLLHNHHHPFPVL